MKSCGLEGLGQISEAAHVDVVNERFEPGWTALALAPAPALWAHQVQAGARGKERRECRATCNKRATTSPATR